MKSGTTYEKGDILIVPFPFSDLSGIEQRPVLVISSNEYNAECDDVVTCGITSNLKDFKYSVVIENNNLENGKIPAKSRVKADKMFTIEKSIIRKKIAKIDTEMLKNVESKLREVLELD